jgi:hypothetical protein
MPAADWFGREARQRIAAIAAIHAVIAPFRYRRRHWTADFVGESGPGRAGRRLRHLRFGKLKRVGARAIIAPIGVRQRRNPGLRFGTSRRPRGDLIPCGHGAHDIGLDHDVGRTADHEQVFDIVTAHQHQPAAAIHRGSVDHGQPRHPAPVGIGTQPVPRESPHQPGGKADQRQNRHECEEKCQSLHALSPANGVFFKSLFASRLRVEGGSKTVASRERSLYPALNVNSPRQKLPPHILITYESLEPKRLLAIPTPLISLVNAAFVAKMRTGPANRRSSGALFTQAILTRC